MTVFFGADHRGFELKNELVEYLQQQNIRVEDLGNYQYDPLDDYPDFAQKVADVISKNPDKNLGVVICGSGIGVSIAANRFKGIRCGLGFDEEQVRSAKMHDHINILALPANHINIEAAKKLVDVFLHTQENNGKKYVRRIKKIELKV